MTCERRTGFSLLEVIIATAILAASAVMLISMISTGDRHTQRADERMIAQMLCLTKLEELIADPSQLVPIQADSSPQYPGWVWSVEVQPSSLDGFVQIRVAVTRIPGMPTGANLDAASMTEQFDADMLNTLPDKPTFELSRWIKLAGPMENAWEPGTSSAIDAFAAGAR